MGLRKVIASVLGIGALFSAPIYAEVSLEQTLAKAKQVDALLEKGYAEFGVKAYEKVDDATFLRRAYVVMIGRIPSYQEAASFLKDKSKDKRSKLVEKLIDSKGFKGGVFLFYAELLRLQSSKEQHGAGWHHYMYQAAMQNKPYDDFVREMLVAKGHTAENPAVGYFLRDSGMLLDNVSNTAQVFLGTQVGCAQCHDHPFEDTTQMDFYKFAAYNGGLVYKNSSSAQKKLREVVAAKLKMNGKSLKELQQEANKKKRQKGFKKHTRSVREVLKFYRRNELGVNPKNTLKLPKDYAYNDGKPGQVVQPGVWYEHKPAGSSSQRLDFGHWLTSPKNEMFTKVIVNRLWAKAFGYGLVEPLDDWTERTKVSHEPVLKFLENEMKQNGYDVKQTMRILFHSELFQRAVSTEEYKGGKSYHFAGPMLRRMRAEQIYDSFLVLESGVVDEKVNTRRVKQWEKYTGNYKIMDELSASKLIKLGEGIKETNEKALQNRRKLRELRGLIAKAKGEGDFKKQKKLEAKLRELRKETNKKVNKSKKDVEIAGVDDIQGLLQFAMSRALRVQPQWGVRSYEMPQPFKAGSFVRTFGGNDGLVSNSSTYQANITQALTLLNGNEVIKATDKKGVLPALLKRQRTPEKRLNTLFVALYSRYPTEKEKDMFIDQAKSLHSLAPLARAMMNSKNFLFVQ